MSMLLNSVIPSVAPVFLIIFIGYMIGRKTNYDLQFVTDITMYFSLPALIFLITGTEMEYSFSGQRICCDRQWYGHYHLWLSSTCHDLLSMHET